MKEEEEEGVKTARCRLIQPNYSAPNWRGHEASCRLVCNDLPLVSYMAVDFFSFSEQILPFHPFHRHKFICVFLCSFSLSLTLLLFYFIFA